ncbi:MAG: bifunctional riboflavin kinase/FAD synthetase [Eubacteriales bacterium]|nr:bifunctional riboflavin kinase/FAD synthetase [Eubacteriales bacterium]
MEYIKGTSDFVLEKPSAVTLGKFDGIHIGHQKLISIVKEKAEENNLLSVLFTFDSIPLSICPQKNQHFLSTNSERKMLCEKYGVDVEIEYPFTHEFMNMEPEEFIEKVLVRKLKAKFIVVGVDFCFGKNRAGNAELLVENGEKYGYETIVVDKEKYQDIEISSTYIRDELKQGHMETVNVLLGRPYSVTGIVAKGNQLGRKLDIPTINIYPTEIKLLPPNGVYASTTIIDGKNIYGVTNLGTKPTVNNGSDISVETNLFNFDEDVYGKKVEVMLLHFLRQEMKFDNVEALKKQMESDASFAKNMFMVK